MSTFVTVGNSTQPFDRLLNAVALVTDKLPQPVVVQRGVSRASHPAWDHRDYVSMQMFDELVREANLLVMHCGAGSVIHAVRAGRRPIVVPRRARYHELVDDHQLEFAEALDKAGYVLLARDPSDLAALVAKALRSERQVVPGNVALVEQIAALFREWIAVNKCQ